VIEQAAVEAQVEVGSIERIRSFQIWEFFDGILLDVAELLVEHHLVIMTDGSTRREKTTSTSFWNVIRPACFPRFVFTPSLMSEQASKGWVRLGDSLFVKETDLFQKDDPHVRCCRIILRIDHEQETGTSESVALLVSLEPSIMRKGNLISDFLFLK